MMAWSIKQQEAIDVRGKNVLVAAAAGSGKTSVLVERIIQRLTDPHDSLTIDRLLVVTFTNAAAAEMRERIGSALRAAAREKGNERLAKQLLLLPSASISTMHAFCQSLIRRHIHLLPIDPKFRIGQTAELMLLEQDVLEELLIELYEKAEDGFLALADAYSGDSSDQSLMELILELYRFSCSQPQQHKWLSELGAPFAIESLADSQWTALIVKRIALTVQDALSDAGDAYEEAYKAGSLPREYAAVILEDKTQIDALDVCIKQGTWQELTERMQSVKFARWPSKKCDDPALKERLKEVRDAYKDKIAGIVEKFFFASEAELAEDLCATAPIMAELGKVTLAFAEAYRKAKQERGILDFNDLERYALAILSVEDDRGKMQPSPVARALQSTYGEIMVDEYQDTNGVQEAIIQMLADPARPNLFFVGDVKQSIYRFRLAEPELFLDKYHRYPKEKSCRRIDLSQNFRSRGGVLAGVNDVFASLMDEAVTEIGYGEAERLNEGFIYPPHGDSFDSAVEFHLLTAERDSGDERSDLEREATWIAEYIKSLLAEGKVVYDKETRAYRPLQCRDITILLRSVKKAAPILLEALRAVKVPGYAEEDSGYFLATEIRVMLALLNVIDNPHQDIPLAAVLRSPIAEMTECELAEVRMKGDGDLYDALLRASESMDKAAAFVQHLDGWRTYARYHSVPELIREIYSDTGYYDYVGAMAGGVLRQANLEALYHRAKKFEEADYIGLFRFLRFIDKMLENGEDFGVAKAGGENDDLVRIMSVHKSKGLEFPVVILANIGKLFNSEDTKKPILLHKSIGVGPYRVVAKERYRYPTIARLAIAEQTAMESRAEELRVLYVAMTRAREKLVMVGSVKDVVSARKKWTKLARKRCLPNSAIVDARSWLDWLAPVLAKHSAGMVLREEEDGAIDYRNFDAVWQIDVHEVGEVSVVCQEEIDLWDKIKRMEPIEADFDQTELDRRLLWRYPHQASAQIPAKLSVTEIKRRFAEQEETADTLLKPSEPTYDKPRFLVAQKRLSAAEYGTMMHTVMQMIDLKGDLSAEGIRTQINGLVEREIIAPDLATAIDISAVAGFFALPLGQRMLASRDVRRELPFGILLRAKDYYPDADEEEIFVQGVADVLFDNGDGWTLIDYKTDRGADGETLRARYQVQIDLYRRAIAKLTGIDVTESYLYALSTKRVVPIH